VTIDDPRLHELVEQHEIRQQIYRYCRGIDRRDYDLVRSCYHPDATDNHGHYSGDVAGFIDYIQGLLPRFERTMHSISNILIEIEGDAARTEAYTVAYHRLRPTSTKPGRDFVAGFRYVDQFDKRAGRWAIADRQVVFEWARMDPIAGDVDYSAQYVVGAPWPDDPVYRALA
jgi:hypothetical protein